MYPIHFKKRRITQFRNLPHDEQALIREFFENKSNGFYVDVGANEPVIESQTFHLDQIGWSGLLLEPIPYYCELLRKRRTGKVIQFACSSYENHNKVLQLIIAGGHSTLNSNPIAVGTVSNETINVTCKTLDSILEENNTEAGFDFISIDIEGHEMEMFKGFTLEKWKPKLVLLEDHVINHEKHRHMVNHGYHVILRTGLNSWYVPRSELYTFSFKARFQFFRKYWLGLLNRKFRYRR
jgi:FkbM family methyltransferase